MLPMLHRQFKAATDDYLPMVVGTRGAIFRSRLSLNLGITDQARLIKILVVITQFCLKIF